MTWNCPDCDEENSDEEIWCTKCGTERSCGVCGAPAEEATRNLANGGEQDVIQCSECHKTLHRFNTADV